MPWGGGGGGGGGGAQDACAQVVEVRLVKFQRVSWVCPEALGGIISYWRK